MDAQETLQMSPGTESIIRASFAKGFYYNDEDNFLKCVEALLPFDQEDQIKEMLSKYKQSVTDMKDIVQDLNMSRMGEAYLTVKMKRDLRTQLRDLREETNKLRTVLTSFVIVTMEKKELLKEEFTVMKLTKLPLTLRGVRGIEEQTEEDESAEDYEEY